MRLAGRRAIVTGGSRGIGRAIVEEFVREGALVLAIARNAPDLEALQAQHTGVRTARLDVTTREDVERLPELAEQLGGLDILVNNAGIWMERPVLEYTHEDWDRTLATNLTAVFDVTRALLPTLLRSESARILNIGAIDGQTGYAKLVAQCASKAGVIGLTRALAKELWDRPITVNVICPAAVDKEDLAEAADGSGPEPSLARPRDVARAAVYLASEDGVRITGSCLDVHGVGFLSK